MTYTVAELREYIAKNVDEVDVLELLDLTSEDLVDTFYDYIEENYDTLLVKLGLTEGENE